MNEQSETRSVRPWHGRFQPTVGKANYIIIDNGPAKSKWSALNKLRRKLI